MSEIPWIEKYRPTRLADINQNQKILDLLTNSVSKGEMTHLLFYGPPGTGKTSAILALGREIFKEYYSNRVIEFNASDDRGINAVRDKIANVAKKYVTQMKCSDGTYIPSYKIIVLDEADSMTEEAQDALRVIIEQYSTVTRFCFIGNHVSKISDAIKSRCTLIYFRKLSNLCMLQKLSDVSVKENMNLSDDILSSIIEVSNGDMRKAIMLLHNYKYTYDYKSDISKDINNISLKKIAILSHHIDDRNKENMMSRSDIYELSAMITIESAHEIIDQTINANHIIDISKLCRKIIANGYPIDSILGQLNKAVIQRRDMDIVKKSLILVYSGSILFKIKECANEYIQLLDYLSCINGISHDNPIYTKI